MKRAENWWISFRFSFSKVHFVDAIMRFRSEWICHNLFCSFFRRPSNVRACLNQSNRAIVDTDFYIALYCLLTLVDRRILMHKSRTSSSSLFSIIHWRVSSLVWLCSHKCTSSTQRCVNMSKSIRRCLVHASTQRRIQFVAMDKNVAGNRLSVVKATRIECDSKCRFREIHAKFIFFNHVFVAVFYLLVAVVLLVAFSCYSLSIASLSSSVFSTENENDRNDDCLTIKNSYFTRNDIAHLAKCDNECLDECACARSCKIVFWRCEWQAETQKNRNDDDNDVRNEKWQKHKHDQNSSV